MGAVNCQSWRFILFTGVMVSLSRSGQYGSPIPNRDARIQFSLNNIFPLGFLFRRKYCKFSHPSGRSLIHLFQAAPAYHILPMSNSLMYSKNTGNCSMSTVGHLQPRTFIFPLRSPRFFLSYVAAITLCKLSCFSSMKSLILLKSFP